MKNGQRRAEGDDCMDAGGRATQETKPRCQTGKLLRARSLATRIEQWEIDILKQGREEGIEKGIEQGFDKGEVALFLKILELKYGPLPDWVKEKTANANAKTIEIWAAKMLQAQHLSDIFE